MAIEITKNRVSKIVWGFSKILWGLALGADLSLIHI